MLLLPQVEQVKEMIRLSITINRLLFIHRRTFCVEIIMPWLASALLKSISSYSCYSTLATAAIQTVQAINNTFSQSVEEKEMSSQIQPDYMPLLLSLLVRIVSNWEFQNSPPEFPLPFMTNGLTLSSLLQLYAFPSNHSNNDCRNDYDNDCNEFLKTLYDQTVLKQEQEEQEILHEFIEEKSPRVQMLFTMLRKASHISPIIQKQRPLANEFTKSALTFILHHSSTSSLYVYSFYYNTHYSILLVFVEWNSVNEIE